MSVVEYSDPDNAEGYIRGETVTFRITVENTGEADISGLNVGHAINGGAKATDASGLPLPKAGDNNPRVFDVEYVVTQEDVVRGKVQITATASADGIAELSDSAEVKVIGTRDLRVSLSANHTVVKNADILTHTLWIRNLGSVDEKDLIVSKLFASSTLSYTESEYHPANGSLSLITNSMVAVGADGMIRIPSLPAGASMKLVFNYTVTSQDIGKRDYGQAYRCCRRIRT